MTSKNKSLLICVVALFVIAILLIVISSVQELQVQPSSYLQNGEQEQQVYSSAVQQNAAQLVEESDRIKEENARLQEELAQQQEALASVQEDLRQQQQADQNADFLTAAAVKFIIGSYQESLDMLQNVNAQQLSAQGLELYNQLRGQLSVQGYKMVDQDGAAE